MGLKELSSRDIVGRFFERLESAGLASWISQASMLFPTDQEIENYKWLGFSPSLRQWVGGRQKKSVRVNGVSITNVLYESTLGISVDDKRRDKTGQIDIRIAEMVDDAINHWATLLTTLIINGESQACYDGQFFFDTDHSEGDSGTQTNDLAVGDYSDMNVGTATNPTADELASVIMKMIQHLYGFKNDQGRPMNQMARKFLVMVPVPFFGNAVTAVYGNNLNTGSGVRDNPLTGLRDRAGITIDVAVNPELTWTTKLAVFRTDGNAKPLIRQVELLDGRSPSEVNVTSEGEALGIQVSALDDTSEHAFKENEELYGLKASRNVDYGYWQHAVLATLS